MMNALDYEIMVFRKLIPKCTWIAADETINLNAHVEGDDPADWIVEPNNPDAFNAFINEIRNDPEPVITSFRTMNNLMQSYADSNDYMTKLDLSHGAIARIALDAAHAMFTIPDSKTNRMIHDYTLKTIMNTRMMVFLNHHPESLPNVRTTLLLFTEHADDEKLHAIMNSMNSNQYSAFSHAISDIRSIESDDDLLCSLAELYSYIDYTDDDDGFKACYDTDMLYAVAPMINTMYSKNELDWILKWRTPDRNSLIDYHVDMNSMDSFMMKYYCVTAPGLDMILLNIIHGLYETNADDAFIYIIIDMFEYMLAYMRQNDLHMLGDYDDEDDSYDMRHVFNMLMRSSLPSEWIIMPVEYCNESLNMIMDGIIETMNNEKLFQKRKFDDYNRGIAGIE